MRVYSNPRRVAYTFVDESGQLLDVSYQDSLLVLQHRIIITATVNPSAGDYYKEVESLVHEYTVVKEITGTDK